MFKLHISWRDNVLEFEDKFLLLPAESVNVGIDGKGVVLTNVPSEPFRPGG